MTNVHLEEAVSKTYGTEIAHYTLIIDEEKISVGRGMRNVTFGEGHQDHESHHKRRKLASMLGTAYTPPTPTLLEYFSKTPILDTIIEEKRANIHPAKEIEIFTKILEALAGRQLLQDGRIENIGNNKATPRIIKRLTEICTEHFPYIKV